MKKLILFLFVFACLFGCKPATEITGAWTNNNASMADRPLNKILVTALTARTNVRQQVEGDIAKALEKKGYQVVKSFDILPPFTEGKTPDKEQLFARIHDTGVDGILTVALIDKETDSRYVPGNASFAPMPRFGYYGTFWGYYNNWYPTLYSPGYYQEEKTYFIETNLYDAKSEELLWSAQSETYNPSSLNSFSNEFAKVVVARLQNDVGNGSDLAKQNNNNDRN